MLYQGMSSNFVPSGVYPALPTPITDDGAINYEASSEHVAHLEAAGVHGVVPAGCTGHAATLGDRGTDLYEEHIGYVEHVAASTDLPIIAGDGMNSTAQTLELAGQIEDAVDIAAHLMISPYQNCPPQDLIIKHYRRLAESLRKPIIAYNVPSRTGQNIAAETTLELAAIDGICGIKEASLAFQQIHQIGQGLDQQQPDGFAFGSGDDPANHFVYREGGTFTISVAANVHPRGTLEVWEAGVNEGDHRKAAALNQALDPLHEAMFQPGEKNPISVQYALNLLGFDFGVPRAPLDRRPREDDTYQNRSEIEAVLAALDLR